MNKFTEVRPIYKRRF